MQRAREATNDALGDAPIAQLAKRILTWAVKEWADVRREPQPPETDAWAMTLWRERRAHGVPWRPRELFPEHVGPLHGTLLARLRRAVGVLAAAKLIEVGRVHGVLSHVKPTRAGASLAATFEATAGEGAGDEHDRGPGTPLPGPPDRTAGGSAVITPPADPPAKSGPALATTPLVVGGDLLPFLESR